MGSREEWYSNKLSNLIQEELRVSTLSELRDHLRSLSNEEASEIVTALQLPLIFDCLNDNNSEQVDLACEVLSLCLNNLTLGEITNRYGNALERALIHPFAAVKLMALKEIERSLADEEALCSFCQQTSIIINVVACLGDRELSVAKIASNIIEALGVTLPGANKITSNEILVPLENLLNLNEVVKLRVYEMIVTISKKCEYSFKKFKTAGLFSNILDGLENNDVLFKMNIIEILSQLAQTDHGYTFLDENGVLNKIFLLISEDELVTKLCEPGVLKFFGHIGHKKPQELMAKYPKFFDHLFSNIESSDLIIIGITLDTIGYIGQTSQGKIALESTGFKIEGTIRTISHLLSSLPTETRIRALNCIENLLRTTRFDILRITEKWFYLLGNDPMEMITRYAKNPFSELRLAGLGIINALAGQAWGQVVIKNTPGLVEFLLDRNAENKKECKEAKYEIIKLLSQSTIFDKNTEDRLIEFVKEGPFYVQTVTEVAFEGN